MIQVQLKGVTLYALEPLYALKTLPVYQWNAMGSVKGGYLICNQALPVHQWNVMGLAKEGYLICTGTAVRTKTPTSVSVEWYKFS